MNGDTKIVNRVDAGFGIVWFIGWLFTVGYLHLVRVSLIKALLAILVWPYFLGDTMGH